MSDIFDSLIQANVGSVIWLEFEFELVSDGEQDEKDGKWLR